MRAASNRRFGGRGGGRRGGGGGAADLYLLNPATAIFARASTGTYRPTANSLALAATDVARMESGLYLIEKYATNLVWPSRDITHAQYQAGSGVTTTADVLDGPDGATLAADQSNVNSGGYGRYRQASGVGRGAATIWRRRPSGAGTGTHQVRFGSAGFETGYRDTASETWERITLIQPNASSTGNGLFPAWSFALTANFGQNMIAVAQNIVTDLLHSEQGVGYPTSTILAPTGTTSRETDILTWLAAEVPLELREGKSLWSVRPCYASSQIISGETRILGSWGGLTDVLRLRHDGTGVLFEALTSTTVRAASGYVTFSADQLMTVRADAAAATLAVAGATTGNGAGAAGTPWAWLAGVGFRLGGVFGGSGNEIDGGIGLPAVTA